MSVPFRWEKAWIVSDYANVRFVVWLGYTNNLCLFAHQNSGAIITITVMEYNQKGQISTNNVVLTDNAHIKIFDAVPKGTHLVLSVSANVATPGITLYSFGIN